MLCAALLLVLLAFATQGQNTSSSSSSSSLRQSELVVEPQNLAVLSGQQARFNCSTTTSWSSMLWRLDESTVVIITASGIASGTDNSSSEVVNCSTPQVSCWELVLKKVVRINALQPRRVTCELLNGPLTTAALHIQERGSVVMTGSNASVPSGQMVQFQCLAHGWFPVPSVDWFMCGERLLPSAFNSSSEVDLDRGLYNTTSTLSLEARCSGSVECRVSVSAMAAPLSRNISLTVVYNRDNSVVIAAVSFVGAMLLIVLIIFCLLFHLRRRNLTKEPPHQETVRTDQHQSKQNSVAAETKGKVNAGYSSEDCSSFSDTDRSVSIHSRRTTASTAEVATTSDQFGLSTHLKAYPKMPDVIVYSEPVYNNTISFISFGDKSVKTRRQVTTV
ncbi:immunoglobulin superfamily member 5 isoform X2 [Clupea harengus]|nr:immunoglobulin superfamily member 5 isoform X2 [Clupea harengus]